MKQNSSKPKRPKKNGKKTTIQPGENFAYVFTVRGGHVDCSVKTFNDFLCELKYHGISTSLSMMGENLLHLTLYQPLVDQ